MKESNFTIKQGLGDFSNLDKEYNSYIKNSTRGLDDEKVNRWDIYDLIMKDLLKLGLNVVFEEVKYRLTDGENPNLVMMEIINRDCYESELAWFLKNRLELYIKEDSYGF